MSNAIKYSPGGGRITAGARHLPEQKRVVILVADQGMGIAPEDLKELFARFQRISRPETEGIRGTGLGLYIVKRLIDLMGGDVWAESTVGQGSVFYFSLPTADALATTVVEP